MPFGAAVVVLVVGALFVKAYPHIGPTTRFTQAELAYQRANAENNGPAVSAGGTEDSSTASHWRQPEEPESGRSSTTRRASGSATQARRQRAPT